MNRAHKASLTGEGVARQVICSCGEWQSDVQPLNRCAVQYSVHVSMPAQPVKAKEGTLL